MEAGEVPLAEVAERFGLSEADVAKDLELVAMCGLPPYVDEMIDVFVDEGMVFVGVPRLFTRPLRLTAPEGFALLVAARAAVDLPGADADGPLARGLAKLADALGQAGVSDGDQTAGVVVDLEQPAFTNHIVEAVAAGAGLTIEYFSPSRAETSARNVVPRHVFADAGNWYVLADDDRSGDRRTFRIDRIESVRRNGTTHERDADAVAPDAFFADADLPRVTLRIAPRAQWIIDRYPIDSVEPVADMGHEAAGSARAVGDVGGLVDVVLPVASGRWLDRLRIRLGSDAALLNADSESVDGAVVLARRMLANYVE
ncbi:MAG: proteasome accessory factor C [Ilumatobacter sp.]|jgi:proteasome accessory factor C